MQTSGNAVNLDPNSYTALRLQHATPEHLHFTSRRCFIGPLPVGWLKHHRKQWFRHHMHYSSRAATFHAAPGTGTYRHTTGIDDHRRPSFSQPAGLEVADEEDGQAEQSTSPVAEATLQEPPAASIPRSSNPTNLPVVEAIPQFESRKSPPTSATAVQEALKRDPVHPALIPDPPAEPRRIPTGKSAMKSSIRKKQVRQQSGVSFVTAKSFVTARTSFSKPGDEDEDDEEDTSRMNSTSMGDTAGAEQSSLSPLLTSRPYNVMNSNKQSLTGSLKQSGMVGKLKSKMKKREEDNREPLPIPGVVEASTARRSNPPNLVRFSVPEDQAPAKNQYVRGKLAQLSGKSTFKRLTHTKMQDGEILKIGKMLVRIEYTGHDLPDTFDENDSYKIDSQMLEKWKEFIIVCRDSPGEDFEFVLQLYKTRIIKAVEQTHVKRNTAYEIKLNRKIVRVGIFSSLDKTIVLWEPYKSGHRFYIMRPRTAVDSMEWFTFLRGLLGSKPPNSLNITVPDLNVHLVLDHPFGKMEQSEDIIKAISGDEDALVRTMEAEEAIAQNIVKRCVSMLQEAHEWNDILDLWTAPGMGGTSAAVGTSNPAPTSNGPSSSNPPTTAPARVLGHQPLGLAWKRYDRLEWVHGANERQMYGTIGMAKTHDLELRPKQHYPTTIRTKAGIKLTEPAPVEGFLIRLTSQRGAQARLGKLFFKRLYFSTHNQYLMFSKPAQADPPPPPNLPMTDAHKIPNSREIVNKIPLIYSVNPYQLSPDNRITWLDPSKPLPAEEVSSHDADAFDEAERVVNLLLKCDGNVNLINILAVRNVQRGAVAADQNIDQGSDVDFHTDLLEDNDADDGTVREFDDSRTFELVLRNGLIIRLQAYDKTTKNEWIKRLRALVRYWTLRSVADMALYKSVRQQNLRLLNIDEDMEALIGQFARKWEVSQSFASAELYNMCGISCCRSVTMSGVLHRKPRMRGTFVRNLVVLCHGHLLFFRDTLRSVTGRKLAHIHHERLASLDLRDVYVYSGLVTEGDLLYTEKAPDSASKPGRHGLPRMYLEDGWSSTDEDTMTCFVIWHGKKTGWFRGDGETQEGKKTKLRRVSQLGVEGKSIVLKARSRAERDHWVISLGMEIERLAGEEDVRIVPQ